MPQFTVPENARRLPRPLESLMAFQHSRVIERYFEDFNVTAPAAHARFTGFKQFIAVAAMSSEDTITSDVIDTMWHTFLLFTRDYERFCREFLGEFIHHEPFETPNPGAYLSTRRFAETVFGPLDERLWPRSAKGRCSSGACRGDR